MQVIAAFVRHQIRMSVQAQGCDDTVMVGMPNSSGLYQLWHH